MDTKKNILTSAGLKEKEERLDYLKNVKLLEVAEKIKEARGFGDLSENAEYDAAKKEQAEVAEEIAKIEAMLKNVEIVDEDDISTTTVTVGSKVKVLDCEANEELNIQIVGSNEVDPVAMKISNESPLGSSLLGHEENEEISVEAPGGVFNYKILEITR